MLNKERLSFGTLQKYFFDLEGENFTIQILFKFTLQRNVSYGKAVFEISRSFLRNAFCNFLLTVGIIMARSGQMITNQLKIK